MINTQYINLNMIPSGVMPVLYCSQYDVGRPLGFVVNNGSEVVNLDQYMVAIEGTRSDGTGIVEDVNTDGNIGVFLTTATMTNKSDIYDMQLVIRSTDTHRVASIPFMMHVRTAALDENSSVIEEDKSLFQQYTETVMIALAEIRSNVESESTARINADSVLLEKINIEAANRAAEDNALNDRIDNIIAPGGAPSAAEVTDARLGADGVLYDTLGEAIRTQFEDVYKNLAYTTNLESDINGLLVVNGGIGGTVPTSLTAKLEPQQTGAGAPSADNIRPFVQFTSISMLHAGESGGGGSGNPPTTPFFGGTQNCITGEWTLYEYFTSYSGVTDLTGVQWWSDRDIYAPGTNPTVGAFVVYEPTTPYTESGSAWGAEAMYPGINQYKMLAYDSVTQTTAPFALTIETDVANVGDVVDGIAHDVSVLQSDMDQTNQALTSLRNEYDITASTVTVHTTLIENNAEDIAKNTADIGDLDDLNTEDNSSLVAAINEIAESGGGGTGLTDAVKQALLACFQKIAWIDEHGQDYYDALHNALYPTVVSITAVYDGTGHTVYDTDTLNSLKSYLTVTATYDDSSERIVHDYALSGTLTAGTSTITVTYQNVTTTFTVTVVHNAASLTAVYTQSGTVYETDSLDSLKTDLVVTYYATQQSQGVVLSDNDYTLSGTLAVGTSTITAIYGTVSASFTVTVTADPAYIEAVFTQPQSTIYTDDALDSLKDYLVVTYYSAPGATGTVLADSAYTLSGTLTEGTSVITASYQGLTDTFNVINVVQGYWDTWEYQYPGALNRAVGNIFVSNNDGLIKTVGSVSGTGGTGRVHFYVNASEGGITAIYDTTASQYTNQYPIPIPDDATVATLNFDGGSTLWLSFNIWTYNTSTGYTRIGDSGGSPVGGGMTYLLPSGTHRYYTLVGGTDGSAVPQNVPSSVTVTLT